MISENWNPFEIHLHPTRFIAPNKRLSWILSRLPWLTPSNVPFHRIIAALFNADLRIGAQFRRILTKSGTFPRIWARVAIRYGSRVNIPRMSVSGYRGDDSLRLSRRAAVPERAGRRCKENRVLVREVGRRSLSRCQSRG